MLTSSESVRYNRQLNLPDFSLAGQERLLAARVVIVGAGGLGCPVGIYLAAAGVGQITVIDNDVVALTNLHRQIAFTHSDLGQPKSERLVQSMNAINPDLRFESKNLRLDHDNCMLLLKGANLVIDGTDNFATKFLIADSCHELKVPYLTTSVYHYACQMMLCVPDVTPCYRCIFEKPPLDGLQSCTEAGVLGSAVGTAGTVAATEAIKFIVGNPCAISGKLLLYDAAQQSINKIELAFDSSCSLCGSVQSAQAIPQLLPTSAAKFTSASSSATKDLHSEELNITVEKCKSLLTKGAALIDVREPLEFAQAHLPGAISVPHSLLEDRLEDLRSMTRPLILYCQKGARSQLAVQTLLNQNFHNLYSLKGGIEAWS